MKKITSLILFLIVAIGTFAQSKHYVYSRPLVFKNQNNITVNGDSINGGSTYCISITNCTNVHIINCKLQNSIKDAIFITGSSGVVIEYNYFSLVNRGVNAIACPKGQIVIQFNQALNIKGAYPAGQFVQLNNVSGRGIKILFNKVDNIPGIAINEDIISIYKCNGTKEDPILIAGNILRGGTSGSGAGITIGDKGGSYQTATNNITVQTGAAGVQCAGGNHMIMTHNTVFGVATSISHIGVTAGNYSGLTISDWTIANNRSYWICGNADQITSKGVKSTSREYSYAYYNKPAGVTINWKGDGNIVDATLTANILPVKLITMK